MPDLLFYADDIIKDFRDELYYEGVIFYASKVDYSVGLCDRGNYVVWAGYLNHIEPFLKTVGMEQKYVKTLTWHFHEGYISASADHKGRNGQYTEFQGGNHHDRWTTIQFNELHEYWHGVSGQVGAWEHTDCAVTRLKEAWDEYVQDVRYRLLKRFTDALKYAETYECVI